MASPGTTPRYKGAAKTPKGVAGDTKTNKVTVFPRETPQAKRSALVYYVVERQEKFTDLLIRLETGRSHQIRAQLAKVGHPIVGDTRYGPHREGDEAIQLRSIFLSLHHPRTGESVSWSLDPSRDMKNFFEDAPAFGQTLERGDD